MSKIGDFPKTTKQIKRKAEISNELQILNTNMGDIKTKLKKI